MDDRDTFALWLADGLFSAADDEIAAMSLQAIAQKANSTQEFDEKLKGVGDRPAKPGDFGVEFLGAMLPFVLVEFGRDLWAAYTKSLVEQGGKALATATVDGVKALLKKTLHHEPSPLSIEDVEETLRAAAKKAKLDQAETERLVEALKSEDLPNVLAGA